VILLALNVAAGAALAIVLGVPIVYVILAAVIVALVLALLGCVYVLSNLASWG
jgi:hypothetical protein